MATRDVPQIDDIDLPDIPDDDDVDDIDDLSLEQPAADGASPDGDATARSLSLPPFVISLLEQLAPLRAAADTALLATAPIRAKVAPYARVVPDFAWMGIGVAVAVLIVGSLAGAFIRGGTTQPAPELTPITALAAAPLPTRKPSATPTPSGPTATPTPVVFEQRDGGWVVTGPPRPNPIHLLPPGQVLLTDGGGDVFTLIARASVGLRFGPSAPIWGVILSHRGEFDHLRIEFYTDSYQRDRPFVGLVETRGGVQRLIGPNSPIPELEFWGRDAHEVRVQVIRDQVQMWVNAQPLPLWKVPGGVLPGKRGLYLWGGSKMRFDSLSIT
ncbi:MAG: hypothetical protein EPO26_05735 [Chloroflexota bacterium]|nr:MAG: hypothetical protein EPO26_05735 [Chloroflexota bacterium]